jgi:periplasmic nitrate reductase NapD
MTAEPTRRALFKGLLQAPDTETAPGDHISSAVISVLPARLADVVTRLGAMTGAEIHHRSASKLVVVLEGPGSGALGAMLAEISSWPGVLSANMVFEQYLDRDASDETVAT